MSRSIFLVFCSITAVLCGLSLLTLSNAAAQNDTQLIPDSNPDHSLEEQQNVDLTKKVIQSLATGDRDYLLSSVSNDVIWEVMGSPMIIQTSGRWVGVKGINDVLDLAGTLWRTDGFQADQIWADGPVVIVSGRETDTALATGKQVSQSWVLVLTWNDNLLTHAQLYGDGAAQYWSLIQ